MKNKLIILFLLWFLLSCSNENVQEQEIYIQVINHEESNIVIKEEIIHDDKINEAIIVNENEKEIAFKSREYIYLEDTYFVKKEIEKIFYEDSTEYYEMQYLYLYKNGKRILISKIDWTVNFEWFINNKFIYTYNGLLTRVYNLDEFDNEWSDLKWDRFSLNIHQWIVSEDEKYVYSCIEMIGIKLWYGNLGTLEFNDFSKEFNDPYYQDIADCNYEKDILSFKVLYKNTWKIYELDMMDGILKEKTKGN